MPSVDCPLAKRRQRRRRAYPSSGVASDDRAVCNYHREISLHADAYSELRADTQASAATAPSSSMAKSLFLGVRASIAPWINNHKLSGNSDASELTCQYCRRCSSRSPPSAWKNQSHRYRLHSASGNAGDRSVSPQSSSIARFLFLSDRASVTSWRFNHELSGDSDAGELTSPAVLPSMLEPNATVSVEDSLTNAPPPPCERTHEQPKVFSEPVSS